MVASSPITGAAIIGGELILSLPTGEIINCGLVQGPPGPKGAVGSPGPKGDPGLDPNTLLHGPGFPDPGLGKSGDFYWMVSPEVGVFGPKTAAGWGSPVILSRPISASKADYKPIMGQAGGSSGGGSGVCWAPVIVSPIPPTLNNAKNPVRVGDLWFDSEQLATYVSVKNTGGDMVWVIATPHNREGLASEVPAKRGKRPNFAFPRAADKEIAYNSTTDTEYIYNAKKKQWIDLSQMVHYGTEPPCHAPKGAIFTHEDTLKQFVHQGRCVWVEQTSCGAGGGSSNDKLTAVKFTAYQVRKYFTGILTEVFWETQMGIHFKDETIVEVDMNNDGTWEDVHQMDQTTLDGYGILEAFDPEAGAVNFVFDEGSNPLGPFPVQPKFACAQLRVTVKNKNLKDPKDFTVKTSKPTFIYPEYTQDPSPNPAPAHPGASC